MGLGFRYCALCIEDRERIELGYNPHNGDCGRWQCHILDLMHFFLLMLLMIPVLIAIIPIALLIHLYDFMRGDGYAVQRFKNAETISARVEQRNRENRTWSHYLWHKDHQEHKNELDRKSWQKNKEYYNWLRRFKTKLNGCEKNGKISWKIDQKKPLEIVALGDIHLGSPECDVAMLKSVVAKIKKRKAKVILLGDLIDLGLRESPGASVYEHDLTPKDQVKEIVKILEPIKGQILSSNIGNHEYRLNKNTGIDLSEILAEKLQCKYGKYQSVNVIKLGKQTYNIFSTHGAGSGQTTESRVNSFKKYLEQIEADVLLFGHCHDLSHRIFNKRVVSKDGFDMKSTHLVLCGNFLNFDNSYGELKGYPVLKKGCPLITLYPDKHKVDVSLEWFTR